MNKLFTQLLEARQISDSFLHPQYTALIGPNVLPDMPLVVSRLKKALKNQEKILIYGDYDVDGITASALMEQALILAGATPGNLEIMLPDRFIDGYGMSDRLLKRAKTSGVTLVITVDCGSRNHEIIKKLAHTGVDTIVTDHHECDNTLPPALAVINPKRPDYTGPAVLRDLAGVGVAFKLAQSLVKENLIQNGQEKWLLDLVLLGTICDNMLLTSENRILTYYGAKVLAKTRRPGLKALIKNAKVQSITAEAIGYQLGPRLNAAGRLQTAELALSLLRTNSAAEASALATKLEKLNTARRTEQRAATTEIIQRGIDSSPVIIEAGSWHEGILGIVAGRLVENYHRPAFVLSEVEKGILKGSGRSFGDFSLAKALQSTENLILGGGGHAGAAGVRLEAAKLPAFREQINSYYQSLQLTGQERYFATKADLTTTSFTDFSFDLLEDLQLLEPFGPGNTEPIFAVDSADVLGLHRMGDSGQHLRLDLRDGSGKMFKLVAFSAPEPWFSLDSAASHRFLIRPCLNEWNGLRSVEGRLVAVQ